MTTTATAPRVQALEPSPTLYGHAGEPVPTGCVIIQAEDLLVGHVLHHAPGTFDLVVTIDPDPSPTTRLVHVLRTVPSGRTVACSFWIGEHARRTLPKVVAGPVR